jgi:hypothetical protein
MDKIYRVPVRYWYGEYPFLNVRDIDLLEVGGLRKKGDIVFVNRKLIKRDGDGEFLEFERVGINGLMLKGVKIMKTQKGLLVLVPDGNSNLYVVEIPGAYRGGVRREVISGECVEASVSIDLQYNLYMFCNGNAEIRYRIYGRTSVLQETFGETLSGKIKVENDNVVIVPDKEPGEPDDQ